MKQCLILLVLVVSFLSQAQAEKPRYIFKKYLVHPERFSSLRVQIPNLRVFVKHSSSEKLLIELRPIPNLNEFQGSSHGKLSSKDLESWQTGQAGRTDFEKVFQFNTEEKIASLNFKLTQDKQFWKKQSVATLPSYALFISGKSIPLDLHWVRGGALVKAWEKDLSALFQSGNLQVWESSGKLAVHALNGDVSIKKHKGSLKLESHSAKVSIEDFQGDVNVQNFKGSSHFSGITGKLVAKNLKGESNVLNSKGEVIFDNGHGLTSINSHDGNIKGNNLDGKVILNMAKDNKVRIYAEDGLVQVKMGKRSGSFVNVGSEEGDVSFPRPLKLQRLSNLKYAKGRLRGSEKGSLFIRNKKGDVKVYY